MTQHLINTALALAMAAVLATAWHLDADDDGAAATTAALAEAQRDAQQADRRERAAQALCRAEHGESAPRWTSDGSLVCTTKQGRTLRPIEGRAHVAEVH